jgi:hypothetical protein
VARNVRHASMALRSATAGMMEAQAGFRRLKPTDNCQLSDGHSPIAIPRIWKTG